MNRKYCILALVLFAAWIAPIRLAAQETVMAYRIEAVEYDIEGRTRESPLSKRLEIKLGLELPDFETLEAYIADKRQLLANERVLEKSDITYTIGTTSNGTAPVYLLVTARDTWNIIALPYPKYTTNDGLLLSIRMRDYNFLGSMENLYLDLDYRFDENKNSSLGIGVSFLLPFELAELDWSINTSQGFAYNFSGRLTYTSENTLRLYLEGEHISWTLRAGQNLYWNEDGDLDEDLDKVLLQSLAGINTEVDLFPLGRLGPLTLTPDIEMGWTYRADGSEISADRRGPYFKPSYSFTAGRSDWIGNFRRGTVLYAKNAYAYNFNSQNWGITVTAQVKYYNVWANRLGLNSRVTMYGSFLGVSEGIGGYLRGIPDARLDGDYAAFLNLDFPLRLFDFKPSLLIKKDWFDFQAHAAPFIDAALVREGSDNPFEPQLCGGLELFGFLKRARSIFARLSLGISILDYLETRSLDGNYELFFGLGHDY